jgi:putative oxidoreductase
MSIKTIPFLGPGTNSTAGDLGLLILRGGIGAMIAYHGYPKFPIQPSFVEGVANMGFPAPTFFAWAAALTELGGGILIAIGLLTRPAGLAVAFNMAVAAFVALRSSPFFAMGDGPAKEMAVLYLLPALFIGIVGAGRFSVDRLLRGK